MKEHKTIRYRLHPGSKAKHDNLFALAGACRFVWNYFVGKLRSDYRYYGSCNPYCRSKGNQRGLAGTQRVFKWLRDNDMRDGRAWLKQYSCAIVRGVLADIEQAYKKFYREKEAGLPKFKAAYKTTPSIPLPNNQTFKVEGEWLHVQKIGQMKLTGRNPYKDGRPVSGRIKYEAGKWYVYVVYEVLAPEADVPHEIKAVGIDRNHYQVATSEREIYRMPDLERLEAKAKRHGRTMQRRDGGSRKERRRPSNRYMAARVRFQKAHKRMVQARTNWCHQVSRMLADKFDVAYIEDLQPDKMSRSAKGTLEKPGKNVKRKSAINKGNRESCWYRLEQCLSYKMSVVKVPAAHTSQTCHECGYVHKGNRQTQSLFQCRECGHRDNADINAALNILASGNGASGRGAGGVSRAMKRQIDTNGL